MAARLFTVEIKFVQAIKWPTGDILQWYECDFAGTHFSRSDEETLKKWVRIMARNVFGRNTLVIFVHREGIE